MTVKELVNKLLEIPNQEALIFREEPEGKIILNDLFLSAEFNIRQVNGVVVL